MYSNGIFFNENGNLIITFLQQFRPFLSCWYWFVGRNYKRSLIIKYICFLPSELDGV